MKTLETLPFTGRDEELSRLHDLFMKCLHNERQMVTIEGEPGIGKSTLVETFIKQLGADSSIALRTFGAPSFGGFRSTFSGLLRSFLSVANPQLFSTSNLFDISSAPALARLAPEIRDIIPFEIPESDISEAGGTHEMESVLDGLRLFLLRLATRKPLVILFEDAHWFEAKIWDAINFLRRTLTPYPILILVTLRQAEISAESEKGFGLLTRDRQTTRIKLEPFSAGESQKLIEKLFGEVIADNIAQDIQKSTGGNPLFLYESLNTLVERDSIKFDKSESRWRQLTDISGRLPAPESAAYIFEERISNFGDDEVNLFRIASLLGLNFKVIWLKELSNLPDDRFVEFLNRALKANLLLSDFEGGIRFYHQLIQNYLEKSIPSDLKKDFLKRIYDYFQKRSETKPEEGPFHQYLASASFDESLISEYGEQLIENNLEAARSEFKSFSTSLALGYLETALKVIKGTSSLDDKTYLNHLYQIYSELGRVALESGRVRSAALYYRVVSIYIERRVKPPLLDRIRLQLGLAEAYYKLARYRRIDACVRTALEMSDNNGDLEVTKELSRLQFIAGLSRYNQGQYDRAIKETDLGLKALSERNVLDPKLELIGLRTKGIILNRIGKHIEARESLTESMRLAQSTNDRREIARAHYYLGVVSQYLGLFHDAMTSYRKSLALCREVDDIETMSKVYNNLGVHFSESADWEEAERYFKRALDMQIRCGAVYAALTSQLNLAGVAQTLGRTEEALAETARIRKECVRLNAVNLIPSVYDSEVEIALHAGDLKLAEKSLGEMGRWLGKTESKFGKDQFERLSGRLQILKGDLTEGWSRLQDAVEVYRDKGESFRAALTMAEGVLHLRDATKRGETPSEKVLESAREFVSEALRIYRDLKFTRRIDQLREGALELFRDHSCYNAIVKELKQDSAAKSVSSQDKLLVNCFGRLKVICPGRHDEMDDTAWQSKKSRALLAYLVIKTRSGRAISRDKICDALWSHLGPDTILSSFHVTLSHLRKSLQIESSADFQNLDLIVHHDGSYTLSWDDRVRCDIREFDELYSSGKSALRDNKIHLASRDFEQARALYSGPLLEDMYDSWIEEAREQYRLRFIEITEWVAKASFDQGEYDKTIKLCQEILLADPTEEVSHRLLMLTLFTNGRRSAAIKQFNSCVSSLSKRLEIEPDQKTETLAEIIRNSPQKLSELAPSKTKNLYV